MLSPQIQYADGPPSTAQFQASLPKSDASCVPQSCEGFVAHSPTPQEPCSTLSLESQKPNLSGDPATVNSSSSLKPKRKRIRPEQLALLSSLFEFTDTPSFDIREAAGAKLGMSNREVQVWFQNRRAKYNRQRLATAQMHSVSPRYHHVEPRSPHPLLSFQATPTLPDDMSSSPVEEHDFHTMPTADRSGVNYHYIHAPSATISEMPSAAAFEAQGRRPDDGATNDHQPGSILTSDQRRGSVEPDRLLPSSADRRFSSLASSNGTDEHQTHDQGYPSLAGPHRQTHNTRAFRAVSSCSLPPLDRSHLSSRALSCHRSSSTGIRDDPDRHHHHNQSHDNGRERGVFTTAGRWMGQHADIHCPSKSRSRSPLFDVGSDHSMNHDRSGSDDSYAAYEGPYSAMDPLPIPRSLGHLSCFHNFSNTSQDPSYSSSIVATRQLPPLPNVKPIGSGTAPSAWVCKNVDRVQTREFDSSLTLAPLMSHLAVATDGTDIFPYQNSNKDLPSSRCNLKSIPFS